VRKGLPQYSYSVSFQFAAREGIALFRYEQRVTKNELLDLINFLSLDWDQPSSVVLFATRMMNTTNLMNTLDVNDHNRIFVRLCSNRLFRGSGLRVTPENNSSSLPIFLLSNHEYTRISLKCPPL
jgi:hypothetical protein